MILKFFSFVALLSGAVASASASDLIQVQMYPCDSRSSRETLEQYATRAGTYYEKEYLPPALKQLGEIPGLTESEKDSIHSVLEKNIRRFLLEYSRQDHCLPREAHSRLNEALRAELRNVVNAERDASVNKWLRSNSLAFLFNVREGPDELVSELRRHAGQEAFHCGISGFPNRSGACVNRCMLAAFKSRQPFFAIFEGSGFDSYVASGIAYNGKNSIEVDYDSMGPRTVTYTCESVVNAEHRCEYLECRRAEPRSN